MTIEYTGSKMLKDLQQDFSKAFPYLKLDFKPANNAVVPGAAILSDLNGNIMPGCIEISDNMTVDQLENLFVNILRLQVKVLRKSGNIWMQTSITSNWTLGQQNQHAKEISATRVF